MSTAVTEFEPDYGYGRFPDLGPERDRPTADEVRDGRVRIAFWLNVFGPENVERLGRDRIESAPAWLIRDLGSDHVLVVTQDNPVDPSNEWRDATDALGRHLGIRT